MSSSSAVLYGFLESMGAMAASCSTSSAAQRVRDLENHQQSVVSRPGSTHDWEPLPAYEGRKPTTSDDELPPAYSETKPDKRQISGADRLAEWLKSKLAAAKLANLVSILTFLLRGPPAG